MFFDVGHGSHCSGTVGGLNVGVAPGANIYGVKVLDDTGSGFDSTILAGMEYIISQRLKNVTRPIVASMSLGGSCTSCQSAVTVSV
jgi:cerevisin